MSMANQAVKLLYAKPTTHLSFYW